MRRNDMSCAIHKKNDDIAKCPVCKKSMCEECADFCEKYGACPTCLKRQVQTMHISSKRGIWYSLLGLVCATIFLIMYIVDIALGKMETNFIIIGAVILAVLLPLTIFLLVYSVLRTKKTKKILENELK